MRKLFFVYVFVNLFVLLLLGACTGKNTLNESEPTIPLMTQAKIQTPTPQLSTETVSSTTTPTAEPLLDNTPTYDSSVTATPKTLQNMTPVLLKPSATASPLVCSQVKSYINIQQETENKSWELMDYIYENEEEITFLMWSSRPYLGPTPTPNVGPPEVLSQSRRVLLQGQTWDLNSGDLSEAPVLEISPLQNPCGQDCPLEVIGISPDNSWQLLQITDAPADYQGFWLANKDAIINLVPYVPFSSRWAWSSDNRMLWLIYSLQDIDGRTYASESMIVDLTELASPQIVFQSWKPDQSYDTNLLSPDEYELVFSPVEKVVLSYEYFGSPTLIPTSNQLEIYLMDVSQNPPQLLDNYEARFPFIIDWSNTLEDFTILELGSTTVTVYALNHDVVYEIPAEVIKQMPQLFSMDDQARTDISSEDTMRLYWNLDRVVISPDLQHIVLMNEREAWVFSCSD